MKNKIKRFATSFLFEITFSEDFLKKMDYMDRHHLEQLARYKNVFTAIYRFTTFVFYLSDINKVRNILQKYNSTVKFPPRAEINRYGLSYSGLSLDIVAKGDSFHITQYFPDGRIETHIIPKDRVFRIYYILKSIGKPVEPATLWELICRDFNITRFFDKRGKFHKNSFLGDRSTYFNFYYYPIKVLEHIGKIRYGKKLEAL